MCKGLAILFSYVSLIFLLFVCEFFYGCYQNKQIESKTVLITSFKQEGKYFKHWKIEFCDIKDNKLSDKEFKYKIDADLIDIVKIAYRENRIVRIYYYDTFITQILVKEKFEEETKGKKHAKYKNK
jgi:hypothetical protein